MNRQHSEKDLHKEYYKLLKKISSYCSEAGLVSVRYETKVLHNDVWPATNINEHEASFIFNYHSTLAIWILSRILDNTIALKDAMLRFYRYTSDDVDTLNDLIFEIRNAINNCCLITNCPNGKGDSEIYSALCAVVDCADEYIGKSKNESVGFYPLISIATAIAEIAEIDS